MMNTCPKNQGNRGGLCISGVSVLQKVTLNVITMNSDISVTNNGGCKVCSINFEPPDIDLCSGCHVYPLFCRAWIISILFRLKKLTWGLDFII